MSCFEFFGMRVPDSISDRMSIWAGSVNFFVACIAEASKIEGSIDGYHYYPVVPWNWVRVTLR